LDVCGNLADIYIHDSTKFTSNMHSMISDMVGQDANYFSWECRDVCFRSCPSTAWVNSTYPRSSSKIVLDVSPKAFHLSFDDD